jgi:hypothetical protein
MAWANKQEQESSTKNGGAAPAGSAVLHTLRTIYKSPQLMSEIIYDAPNHYFQSSQKENDLGREAAERLCTKPF